MPKTNVGSVRLCWESFGAGEPLVLVMGIGAQMVMWDDDLCQALVERGFRVIRFDNRDVGASTWLRHLGMPDVRRDIVRWTLGQPIEPFYTITDMADDLAGLLDALELPAAHVVGASMGGMIAQRFALQHPHRTLSLTSIMSHPGDRWSSLPRPRALRALLSRPTPRTVRESEESMVEFFRQVGSRGLPTDEASMRHKGRLQFSRGLCPDGAARQMSAILAEPDRRPRLRGLRVPTLVVHGSEDRLVRPIGGRETARVIPGARYLEIAGMGHDLPRAMWGTLIEGLTELRRRVDVTKTRRVDGDRTRGSTPKNAAG